jgi:hypothetical protein
MLKISPIADICHLTKVAPVDLHRITEVLQLNLPTPTGRMGGDLYEDRYLQAVKIATYRLTGNVDSDLTRDDYVTFLIHHHARSILLPLNLIVGTAFRNRSPAENAEIFEVPPYVVEKRLMDADVRGAVP